MDHEDSDVPVSTAERIVTVDEPPLSTGADRIRIRPSNDPSILLDSGDKDVKDENAEEKAACDGGEEKMDEDKIDEEKESSTEKETQMEEENSTASFDTTTNESAQVKPDEFTPAEKESNGTLELSQAGDEETSVENRTQMSNESTQVTVTNVEASAASLKSNSSSAESTSSISDEAKANYRFRSPDTWSVDEVEQFITSTGFSRESQTFREQEIDGKSLLLLKRDDVLTGLGFKLGPALKIYSFIHHLQNFNLLTVLATPPGSVTSESTVDNEANNTSTNVNCNMTVNPNSPSANAEHEVAASKDNMQVTEDAATDAAPSQVKDEETPDPIVATGGCEGETTSISGEGNRNDSHMPSSIQVDRSSIDNDSLSPAADIVEPLEADVEA